MDACVYLKWLQQKWYSFKPIRNNISAGVESFSTAVGVLILFCLEVLLVFSAEQIMVWHFQYLERLSRAIAYSLSNGGTSLSFS